MLVFSDQKAGRHWRESRSCKEEAATGRPNLTYLAGLFSQLRQPLHVSALTWSYGQALPECSSLGNSPFHGKNTCRKQTSARKPSTYPWWPSARGSSGRYTVCHLKLAVAALREFLSWRSSTSLASPTVSASLYARLHQMLRWEPQHGSGPKHRNGPSWCHRHQSGVVLGLAPWSTGPPSRCGTEFRTETTSDGRHSADDLTGVHRTLGVSSSVYLYIAWRPRTIVWCKRTCLSHGGCRQWYF